MRRVTSPIKTISTYSRPAKQVLVDSPGRFGFLNLSVAVWNGKDPVLKERLFGLTDGEGNHGEDAKEYWWAVDGTPTHSWMRWLHRYPQAEYPYRQLREANAARGRADREYELAAPPPPVECRVTA